MALQNAFRGPRVEIIGFFPLKTQKIVKNTSEVLNMG